MQKFVTFKLLPSDNRLAHFTEVPDEGVTAIMLDDVYQVLEFRYGKDNKLRGTRLYCVKAGVVHVSDNAEDVTVKLNGAQATGEVKA